VTTPLRDSARAQAPGQAVNPTAGKGPPPRPFHFLLGLMVLARVLPWLADPEGGRGEPADRVLQALFKSRRQMGSRDRMFVAEGVYHALRRGWLMLEAGVGDLPPAQRLSALLALAWIELDWTESDQAPRLTEQGFEGAPPPPLPAPSQLRHVLANMVRLTREGHLGWPEWIANALRARLPEAEWQAAAQALQQPAPVDLRINPIRTDRGGLIARLAEGGHEAMPTPYSPDGVRLVRRTALFTWAAFREGWFEVQDEGSQLVGRLLAPQGGERVLDLCAGAGGKTLHLSALMQGRGSIFATDLSARRLAELTPRLRRAGVSNVQPQAITGVTDRELKRRRGSFDRVLIDAPCSGSGTLRRNPDLAWHEPDWDHLLATQAELLEAGVRLLKPGGRLVYATCSLLPQENQQQIERLRAVQPELIMEPAAAILAEQGIKLDLESDALELWPHRHGCDGFFALAIRRPV